MERRDFLLTLAGLPFVVGACRTQGSSERSDPDSVSIVAEGLARMRARDVPGLVLVVPEERAAHFALGSALLGLVKISPDVDEPLWDQEPGRRSFAFQWSKQVCESAALIAASVIICVGPDDARAALGSDSPHQVVDVAGRVLRASAREMDYEPRLFATRMAALVFGPRHEHLKTRVAGMVRSLDAPMRAELEALLAELTAKPSRYGIDSIPGFGAPRREPPASDDDPLLQRAAALLQREPRLIGAFALAALKAVPDGDVETFVVPSLVDVLFAFAGAGAALPLGALPTEFVPTGSCGSFDEIHPDHPDAARTQMECGLMQISSVGNRYLRFVGDAHMPPYHPSEQLLLGEDE